MESQDPEALDCVFFQLCENPKLDVRLLELAQLSAYSS